MLTLINAMNKGHAIQRGVICIPPIKRPWYREKTTTATHYLAPDQTLIRVRHVYLWIYMLKPIYFSLRPQDKLHNLIPSTSIRILVQVGFPAASASLPCLWTSPWTWKLSGCAYCGLFEVAYPHLRHCLRSGCCLQVLWAMEAGHLHR